MICSFAQTFDKAPNRFNDIDQRIKLPFFSFGAHTKYLISWYHSKEYSSNWTGSWPRMSYGLGINLKLTPIKYFSLYADIDYERSRNGFNNDYFYYSDYVDSLSYIIYDLKVKDEVSYLKVPVKISYNFVIDKYSHIYIGIGAYTSILLSGKHSYSFKYNSISSDYFAPKESFSVKNKKLPNINFINSEIEYSPNDYGYLFFIGGNSKIEFIQYYWELNINIGKNGIYNHNDYSLGKLYPTTTKIKSIGLTIGFCI